MSGWVCDKCGEHIPEHIHGHLCLGQTLVVRVFAWLARHGDSAALAVLQDEIERRKLQSAYILALSEIVGYVWETDKEPSARHMWAMLCATPAQRCDAAMRVLE